METKKCSKCKNECILNDFYKDKNKKDGLKSECKTCSNYIKKKYRQNNIEKVKESSKKSNKKYYENNSDIILNKNKIWRKNNPNVYIDSKKKSDLNFHIKNPNYVNSYRKNKRDNNSLYKLVTNIRSRLNNFYNLYNIKKTNKTFNIIGCTPEFLKEHLEKQFIEGMNWNNHGLFGWHIDHIIPLSSAKTEEELYKLCNYTNLQPLWAIDNLKKSNKLIKTND